MNYHGPAPVIQKCGQPGVLRPDIFKPFGVILCDDCDRDTREKRDNATS